MALFDRIKQEREKLKGLSSKEKAGYFVEYYKWHVIIIVALAVWVGITIHQAVTTPDVYLCGVLFNSSDLLAEEEIQGIVDGFSQEEGLDSGKETLLLHTNLTYFEREGFASSNYESMEILSTWILAGEVDFIIADANLMNRLAEGKYLLELPASFDNRKKVSDYLLDVSSSQLLGSIYGDLSETLTLGIAVSSQNTDRVLTLIDYLEIEREG